MPIVSRIRRLNALGIFADYRPDDAVPPLKRYNLFYGFNGTGKTTLSRVFRGLDTGRPNDSMPSGAYFEIELSDGRVVKPDAAQDALQGRVLVFNVDFVNDNLKWSEGSANPVFYLGRKTSRDVELLRRIEARLPVWEEQRDSARADSGAKDRALNTFYTNKARLIGEALEAGRRYNAHHLKQDYQRAEIQQHGILSEQEIESRKRLIRQGSAYDKAEIPSTDIEDLLKTLQDAKKVCESSVARTTLDELDQHPAMIEWMKSGFEYHKEQGLTECLFCGSSLVPKRLDALGRALDEGIEKFFHELEALVEKTERLEQEILQVRQRLPKKAELSPSYSSQYSESVERLTIFLNQVEQALSEVSRALTDKRQSPTKSTWPETITSDSLESQVRDLESELIEVGRFIENHNDEQDNFEAHRSQARNELKFSYVLEHKEEHDRLVHEALEAQHDYRARERLVERARERAQRLRTSIRDHGPAVERINILLSAYLGHKELQLQSYESGYQILRNGSQVKAPLSEGERTAIALCYFLSKVDEEGRDLTSQIVIVDDPVSSLDAGALNYTFNLLRSMLQNAEQLIVLTHNIAFMNETKKWLRKHRDEGRASLFYVHSWTDMAEERRKAAIVEMPKLLRGYDSEYHYLFYLVKRCADEGVTSENVPGHVMPNTIRRVLELFLAFKIPDSQGLQNKVDSQIVHDAGLNQPKMQAINRLTQLESHSDSMDDFVGFSSLTIEETQKAAEAVLELMRAMDNSHYDRLVQLAR